jgi:hypothetical protein
MLAAHGQLGCMLKVISLAARMSMAQALDAILNLQWKAALRCTTLLPPAYGCSDGNGPQRRLPARPMNCAALVRVVRCMSMHLHRAISRAPPIGNCNPAADVCTQFLATHMQSWCGTQAQSSVHTLSGTMPAGAYSACTQQGHWG